jgi:hypothetical protein
MDTRESSPDVNANRSFVALSIESDGEWDIGDGTQDPARFQGEWE